jgi:hypothetical protein
MNITIFSDSDCGLLTDMIDLILHRLIRQINKFLIQISLIQIKSSTNRRKYAARLAQLVER